MRFILRSVTRPMTSTWASTLTAVVDLDVLWTLSPSLTLTFDMGLGSRCNVNERVNVYVAVKVKGWVKVTVDGKVNSRRGKLLCRRRSIPLQLICGRRASISIRSILFTMPSTLR